MGPERNRLTIQGDIFYAETEHFLSPPPVSRKVAISGYMNGSMPAPFGNGSASGASDLRWILELRQSQNRRATSARTVDTDATAT
jgi:hypothetical protein